jgi:PKD repeat protein
VLSAEAWNERVSDLDGQSLVYEQDRFGLWNINRIDFRINRPPVVTASDDATVTYGDPVTVSATATDPDGDPIVAYAWNIEARPDGSVVELDDPASASQTLVPDVPGTYVLSVVASDDLDESLPDSVNVLVVENLPPTAVASAEPTSGVAPLLVQFDGAGSSDPEGEALTYVWDFGDLSPRSSEVAPSHTYTDAGEYVAVLTVTDERGAVGTANLLIRVLAPVNQPPTIDPAAVPVSGEAPLAVQFSANASDPEGDVLNYAWDFGDPSSGDNTSVLENPTHTYMSAGVYTARLTVSDSVNEVSGFVTISVSSPLAFDVSAATVKLPNNQKHDARVTVWADFGGVEPLPDDLVSVRFDDVVLAEVPFSAFVGGELDDVYWYRERRLLVRLNLAEGRLVVFDSDVNLLGFDPTNDVPVELWLGDAVGVDAISLTPNGNGRYSYRR